MGMTGLICFLAIIILSSCRGETKPEGILTHAQMVDWIRAVYIAEARTSKYAPVPDSAYKYFLPYQDSLRVKKGISEEVLRESFKYYFGNPKELESIYETVIDSLSLQEQVLRQGRPIHP